MGHGAHATVQPSTDPRAARWDRPLELAITILLGVAAIATAGSVYLSELQDHHATEHFTEALNGSTNTAALLVIATEQGTTRTQSNVLLKQVRAKNAKSKEDFVQAKEEQHKAARYTLIEVILATALFLFGVAGVTHRFTIRLGTFGMGSVILLTALILLLVT